MTSIPSPELALYGVIGVTIILIVLTCGAIVQEVRAIRKERR